jgi:hypothetical protein
MATGAVAREYRVKKPIPTPQKTPSSAQGQSVIRPLDWALVEAAVEAVYEKYNTPEFLQALSPDFFDASRLEDAIDEKVPRDAILRVRSVQGIQVYEQTITPSPGGGPDILTSIVSVTVDAQMEFTDPETGQFERRTGVNEMILRIHERITK